MSTEIKNTLFRFVTMRAPELSEESLKEKRFVFRNSDTHFSFFDNALDSQGSGVTKWQAMQNAAKTFSFLTEESLRELIHSDFLAFSIWIARNKHSFKTTELFLQTDNLNKALSTETLTALWDNLFYQVLTQKDFYVKEMIMQLLVANHIYENKATIVAEYQDVKDSNAKNLVFETELIKQIVNAKVVLPKELFEDNKVSSVLNKKDSKDQVNSSPVISLESKEMKQFFEASEAQDSIDTHKKLKTELKRIEKLYQKEYQEEYEQAAEEYQTLIEPILEQYNKDVEDMKKDWCAIRNPDVPYDANDPCNQLPILPQPKLPKFKFDLESEPSLKYLQSLLSEESFYALLNVLGIAEDYTEDEGKGSASNRLYFDTPLPSLSEVYSAVEVVIAENSQTIINNIPSQNTTSVSVGGIILPPAIPDTAVPFSYQVCAKKHTLNFGQTDNSYVDFGMTLKVPDETWEILGVQTSIKDNAELLRFSFSFNESRNGNTIILSRLFNEIRLPFTEFESGINNFEVIITFSNGIVKHFTVPNWKTISCFSGVLKNVTTDPSDEDETEPEYSFIPSGFGVKQLGIADYKKVEQTVQGYIEGDVAHIENVMAREFKEKATRKLRRSENTTSISSETEKEQLSDTTSTDRFEMQSEVAKVLQEGKDFASGASFDASYRDGQYRIGTNVNMATHSSKDESNRHAITQAKEVTERAMERIVSKVKEERITKIVEEFEENNKHGFDNTKGDKHVVGVFRWVDKVYKNQVLNYGKRLMFEFMVPQPAKLHLLGMSDSRELTSLVKPIDPREFKDAVGAPILMNLDNYSKINDNTAKYWGGLFNVDLKPKPEAEIYIGKAFSYTVAESDWNSNFDEIASGNEELKIPEGYYTTKAKASWHGSDGNEGGLVAIAGGKIISSQNTLFDIDSFQESIPVSFSQMCHHSGSVNFAIKCYLLPETIKKWQQETFKAIIDAYDEALIKYNQKLAEENALGIKIKGENPGFYRQIENTILRKNCISYIIDQNETAKRTYGKDMFKPLKQLAKRNFSNHEVNVGSDLDDYASFVKFMEQAFEWEIMSYNFYPYYWGAKKDWASLYQYDNNDPLFRSFMQSGMARVIVTVRPGFEEAVNYYMQTGQIWNGGEVPVIEDKLFMSIVDELSQTLGQKEGKAWATRLPTALTILQAQTIGLNVVNALPFDKDLSDFEDPDSVPQSAGLDIIDSQLGISQSARIVGKIKDNHNIESKIVLKNLDGTVRDLTYCDSNGNWELNDIPVAKYELLLDANNDFPSESFTVIEGSKEQTVELSASQTLEINMMLKKL